METRGQQLSVRRDGWEQADTTMRTQRWSGCERSAARLCHWLVTGLFLLASHGCQTPAPTGLDPAKPPAKAAANGLAGDSAFTLVNADGTAQVVLQAPRLVHELAVLHVLVPEQEEVTVEKIWNFLREDALDAETQRRLRQNGLRIGVGHAQWWAPIKTALDGIDDHRVTFARSIRVPVGFPLSLELDSEPRGQTLFYVGSDGIISGDTWPDSRNVLRVSYVPDLHDADNVVMQVVPEVHQRQTGWEWVRTEAGLWEWKPARVRLVTAVAGRRSPHRPVLSTVLCDPTEVTAEASTPSRVAVRVAPYV